MFVAYQGLDKYSLANIVHAKLVSAAREMHRHDTARTRSTCIMILSFDPNMIINIFPAHHEWERGLDTKKKKSSAHDNAK